MIPILKTVIGKLSRGEPVVDLPVIPSFDAQSFFAEVKNTTGGLNQVQVDTINGILEGAKDWPLPWVAYALATAWHEARFKPQREWGRGKGRRYGKPGKYGHVPYGRGLVQLTWDYNYEWADKSLDLQGALLRDFDLALDPKIATRILLRGLQEGAFNPKGKGIDAYIPREHAHKADYIKARILVNLNDKASLIAGHAVAFEQGLRLGGWEP